MLLTLSYIIIGFIFGAKDLPDIYKNEQWVNFFLYLTLLTIGLVLAVLWDFGVTIPSPSDTIKKVVEFVFGVRS